jgi:hypothetical protein
MPARYAQGSPPTRGRDRVSNGSPLRTAPSSAAGRMPLAFSARVARLAGPLRRALRSALDAALTGPSLQPVSSMSGPSKPTGSALARWAQYPRPYGSVEPVLDTRSGRKGGPCSSGSPVRWPEENGGTCGAWADGRQAFDSPWEVNRPQGRTDPCERCRQGGYRWPPATAPSGKARPRGRSAAAALRALSATLN